MILIRIAGQIGEGQHRDRWLVGEGRIYCALVCGQFRVFDFRFVHCTDETDTFADDCADQSLALAIVADRSARGVDPAVERRFRDDPSAPDRSQKVVFADDPVTVSDQEGKQVEHLRFDRQQGRPPAELAAIRIKNIFFKLKQRVRVLLPLASATLFAQV